MKKHVIRKLKRPSTLVEFFPINESIGFHVETTFGDTGKLIQRSAYLSDDLLTLTNESIFDSEQSYFEFQNDAELLAYFALRRQWNRDHGIIDIEKTVTDYLD